MIFVSTTLPPPVGFGEEKDISVEILLYEVDLQSPPPLPPNPNPLNLLKLPAD